ncbi:NACHT domain-containing protein [Methylotenera mobilis]|uniref:NACHT domain-containing protein n=1 Tax=Methylotenera mobilis TaxID=359408 RepID=UPI0003A05CAD|nr:NACHT domain-containing protein [Methylotenera mobilis]
MVATPAALALSLLRKPLEDLYNLGKEKFETELNEWKNDAKAKQLVRKVLVYDKVRTIWQKTKDVRISQMYYAPRIIFSDEVTRSVDSLAKIPTAQNYVIEGTVGQGKSVFLRYLCLQELKENSTGRIPIFIELRTIEKHLSLENAIKAGLDNLGFVINDALYEFYLKSGKIVLLLDGFDELPSKHILSVMEELECLSVKYSSLQVIVTSRPDRDIQGGVNNFV